MPCLSLYSILATDTVDWRCTSNHTKLTIWGICRDIGDSKLYRSLPESSITSCVYNLSIHTAGILQDREFHGHNPALGSSRSYMAFMVNQII